MPSTYVCMPLCSSNNPSHYLPNPFLSDTHEELAGGVPEEEVLEGPLELDLGVEEEAEEEAASVEAVEDGPVEPEAVAAAKVGLQLSFPAATVA